MLDDPLLASRADEFIRTERINADWALERAIAELHEIFAREGASWLQERAGDLADVAGRLQRNLRPGWDPLVDLVHELEPPLIVVADDLPPSVAAQLDWTRVRGLVCDAGSPTHHTVILARSLGVPAVVGLGRATRVIAPGQSLAIDGETGEVLLDPSDEVLDRWRRRAATAEVALRALDELRGQPAVTADGVRIRLEANLEIAEEVGRVRDSGAEGIGLYRSEFLLDAAHPDSSTEEAQIHTYRQLLEAMRPMPVTIRTFDAGDERGEMGDHRERFGLRGIRAGLHHDPRFVVQIRALLRAASAGNLRILLPFVTSGEELRRARGLIDDIAQSIGMTVTVPIGAMIEVPAAALAVDHLASVADFLSVGTNDLIQYTLAADRTDEQLAGHYEPRAPAIARLLRLIAVTGRRSGRDLSVCGEMAADPLFVVLLVGSRVSRAQHDAIRDSGRETQPGGLGQPERGGHRAAGAAGAVRRRSWRAARTGGRGPTPRGSRADDLVKEQRMSVTRVDKPWGYEIHWAKTDRYVGKVIHINKGHALSLQYHNIKDETIFLWSGKILFEIDVNGKLEGREMKPGEAVHVTPKTIHRMTAIEDSDVFEASTPELQDVVRLEDRYGRQGT